MMDVDVRTRDAHRIDAQLLSDMWIFRSVARIGSITATGRQLGVTQGAVSQRVLRLEARLGNALFLRRNGRLSLTDAGQALFAAMNEVSATLGDALGGFDRGQRQSLIVSCLPSLATEWLVPHLGSFYAKHPDIELLIRGEVATATAGRMEDDGIDVLIGYQRDMVGDLHELASLQEMILPVCTPAYRDAMAGQAVPAITRLHDDAPWPGGPRYFEWSAWAEASPGWADSAEAERYFNLAHLAYRAALCDQGVAIGRMVLMDRFFERGELVAATGLPPVAGAIYRVVTNRPGREGSAARKFAAWLIAEMSLSQQGALTMAARQAGDHAR